MCSSSFILDGTKPKQAVPGQRDRDPAALAKAEVTIAKEAFQLEGGVDRLGGEVCKTTPAWRRNWSVERVIEWSERRDLNSGPPVPQTDATSHQGVPRHPIDLFKALCYKQ